MAAFLLGGTGAGHAAVRIAGDTGGRIGDYVDKYRLLRDSGDFVVVDGLCTGACTLVFAAIPRERLCMTSNAKFGFRAAWDDGPDGQEVVNPDATRVLYAMFPAEIQRWIAQRGGLTAHMIFLEGSELQNLYRSCAVGADLRDGRQRETMLAMTDIAPLSPSY